MRGGEPTSCVGRHKATRTYVPHTVEFHRLRPELALGQGKVSCSPVCLHVNTRSLLHRSLSAGALDMSERAAVRPARKWTTN